MYRKTFLKKSLSISTGILAVPFLANSQDGEAIFSKEEIKEFVFAAHNDLVKCKQIMSSKPLILNCTNQSKKGDFETALGGASHMGRGDIADLLIGKGARMDIFSHAFLGHDELVKAMIDTYPKLLFSPGPHGFTLLHHAEVGKNTKLSDWIRKQGLEETFFKGVFG